MRLLHVLARCRTATCVAVVLGAAALTGAACGGGDGTDDAGIDEQGQESAVDETGTVAEEATTSTEPSTSTSAETSTTAASLTEAESVSVRIVTADDPDTDQSQNTPLNLYPDFFANSLPELTDLVDVDRVIADSRVPMVMLIELPATATVGDGTLFIDEDVVIEELREIGPAPVATGEVVGVGADREAIIRDPYLGVFAIVFDTQEDQVEQIDRLDAMLEPALADIVAALEAGG